MKKAIFTFAIVVATVSLPAQSGGFGLKLGSFSPDGDYLDTWYGNTTAIGFTYTHHIAKRMTIEYGVEYIAGNGDSYFYYDEEFDADINGDSRLEMIPVTLTIRYQPCTRRSFCPYVGAGLGFYLVEETLDYDVYDYAYDESYRVVDSDDDSVVGVHGVAGFDARLRGGGAVTGEIKWSSAEGRLWDQNLDYGGVTATIGYRFSF